MKIYSKYQDCLEGKQRGEVPNPSTPYYVDSVGFISMEQQIKGLINAGINLENYRRSTFDYQVNSEAIEIDNVDVSVENEPDFMPSVDMPLVVDSMIVQNSSSERSEAPLNASKLESGDTTPPSNSDAS